MICTKEERTSRATISYRQKITQQFQLTLPFFNNHSPYGKALNQTLKSTENCKTLTSTPKISSRKSSRISIMPFIRQKIKVNMKNKTNLFQTKKNLQKFKNTHPSVQKPRYENSFHRLNIQQFFTMLSFMYNKNKSNAYKLQVFIDEFIVYCKTHKQKQLVKQVLNINTMSFYIRKFLINNGQGQFKYNSVKSCQGQLSKLLFFISYELYLYKNNKQDYAMLATIHNDIQYYSRRLKMLNLTISCCMNMGKINLNYHEYSKAQIQYRKVLKLAVFLNDKYMQQRAIDKLGVCQYYRGDIVLANHFHNSFDRLAAYDKAKMKQNYSNQYQIKKILQQKTKEKSEEDKINQFYNKQNMSINFDNRTIDTQYVKNNYIQFRNELKQIIKIRDLRKKVPLIKSIMDKNAKIGIKKYYGKGYYVPKASKFHNKQSQQVSQQCLVSHKSYNRSNLQVQTMRIDKNCKIIDQILNFCMTEFKSSKYIAIQEERQSIYEEEAA